MILQVSIRLNICKLHAMKYLLVNSGRALARIRPAGDACRNYRFIPNIPMCPHSTVVARIDMSADSAEIVGSFSRIRHLDTGGLSCGLALERNSAAQVTRHYAGKLEI